ncbi:MAG: dephospho-CoA kinase [Terriglobales bacterium]
MLKVGLTGGIACGKSTVAEMFAARGAHVVKADEIAHQLFAPGTEVYEEVVRRFGRGILRPDGTIDRPKLAAIVFAPERPRILELNALVHPAVVAHQDRWSEEIRQRDPQGLAVVEAALILEAGARDHFDRLVVVACDPEQKVERLAKRLGLDLATARREVERRSEAQLPDEEKQRQADYVIDNSGPLAETEAQVERIFAELKREAKRHL